MTAPLAGVKVLDLTRVLSGPYATMTLADLGADVVKIEPPTGDDTRAFGPPYSGGVSTYFMSVNRGKRSMVLDLKDPAQRETLLKLAQVADVVIENFRPGVMERLGLGYERLKAVNPRLVYCAISGFGQTSDEPGYDLVIQGWSGIPSLTGPGDAPWKCGASIADLVAGLNAGQGVLAALFRRERTGEGAFVDVSMLDGQLSLLTYHAGAYFNAGGRPKAMGNDHPSIHPFRTYRAQDGFFNLAVGNDALFRALCRVLNVPWDQDERFATNAARVSHRRQLDALLEPRMAQSTVSYWLNAFEAASVPCGPMADIAQALGRAAPIVTAHPSGDGELKSLPPGFSFDGQRLGAARPPPGLGEHAHEIVMDWLKQV